MNLPDTMTLNWVQETIGECEVDLCFAHDHGYSRLWRLKSANGIVWLKMHSFVHKWAGEVHALTRWASGLGISPEVIAYRADPEAVLLSEVEGIAAEDLELSSKQEERMWNEAGDWLRRLHKHQGEWFGAVHPNGSPIGQTSNDPVAFVGKTFDQRLHEGREMSLLDSVELKFIELAIREWLPSLEGETSFAIHRDFSPRNWMAHPDGRLAAVIDFEHARWDIRAADMNRWWDHDFLRNPRLESAFFEAYGHCNEPLKLQIRVMRLLSAFGGLVWATKVNDAAFAKHNRDALHRMIGEN